MVWRILQTFCVMLLLVGLISAWPGSSGRVASVLSRQLIALAERHVLPEAWSAEQCRRVELAFGVSAVAAGGVGLVGLAVILRRRAALDDSV